MASGEDSDMGKSDKKHVPYLICCEDKKQAAVMIWGCVSSRGVEALIPVLGTIDSVKYIEIFSNYFIPSSTWYFGNHTAIFQQDNASCYALRIVTEYLDKNDIFTLYRPPQSSEPRSKHHWKHTTYDDKKIA